LRLGGRVRCRRGKARARFSFSWRRSRVARMLDGARAVQVSDREAVGVGGLLWAKSVSCRGARRPVGSREFSWVLTGCARVLGCWFLRGRAVVSTLGGLGALLSLGLLRWRSG